MLQFLRSITKSPTGTTAPQVVFNWLLSYLQRKKNIQFHLAKVLKAGFKFNAAYSHLNIWPAFVLLTARRNPMRDMGTNVTEEMAFAIITLFFPWCTDHIYAAENVEVGQRPYALWPFIKVSKMISQLKKGKNVYYNRKMQKVYLYEWNYIFVAFNHQCPFQWNAQ